MPATCTRFVIDTFCGISCFHLKTSDDKSAKIMPTLLYALIVVSDKSSWIACTICATVLKPFSSAMLFLILASSLAKAILLFLLRLSIASTLHNLATAY